MPQDPADPHNLAPVAEAAAETILIATEGPDPAAHARQIEELLQGSKGVISVKADPDHARVVVTFNHLEITAPDLHDLILQGGYQPSPWTPVETSSPPGAGLEEDLPLTADEFTEYVEFHASRCTADKINELTGRLVRIREKLGSLDTLGKAPAQFALLADLLEAFAAGSAREIPFKVASEAAVALIYLERPTGLIPDSLPEIGFLDDAAVVQTVFVRNAGILEEFANSRGINWAEVGPG